MAFQFVSPGAEALKALQAELLMREKLKSQQAQDELAKQQESRMERALAAEIERSKATEGRLTAAETRAREAEEYARVGDIVEDAGADTSLAVDSPQAAMVKKFRPERIASESKAEQGDFLGNDEENIPQYNVLPGVVKLRPGFKYEQARATEDARKDAARIAAESRRDTLLAQIAEREARAQDSADLRRELAQMNAGLRQQGLDIQQQGVDIRQDAADQKTAEAKEAKENTRKSMEEYGSSLMRNAEDLIDPGILTLPEKKTFTDLTDEDIKKFSDEDIQKIVKPTLARSVGTAEGVAVLGAIPSVLRMDVKSRELGKAAIDNLASMLAVNTLLDLKKQSRTGATGFGALSERELSVIENAASRLRAKRLSDTDYAREVLRIYAAAARSRGAAQVNDPSKVDVKSLREKYGY